MATQTVRIATFPNLTTPKIGLFDAQAGTEVVAEDTATVAGDASAGIYSRDFTDVAAGRYAVIAFDGTTEVARDYVTLTLTTATFYSEGMQEAGGANTTTPPTVAAISTQIRADLITDHGSGAWTTATGFSTHDAAAVVTAMQAAADDFKADVSSLATSAELAKAVDRSGYCLTILAGAVSDAQTAAAEYTLTLDTEVHTVTYAGLTAAGVRTAPTLSKA